MNYIHSKTQIQKLLKLSSLIFFSLAVLSFFVQFYINSRNKSTPFNFVPSHALPIFEDKELKKHTGIIIIPNQNYLVEDIKRIIFDPRDYIPQSMIRRYTYVYQLNIMGTKYWCSENLIYYLNHEKKSVFLDFSFDPAFSFLPFIFITLGLCILILKPLITDNKPILFFLLYITLWVSSILMFFYINGFFFVYNVDYDQWFTMAQELINGNRVSRLNNTFGNTYLYMLFIILFDANTFNDIAVPFSLFNLAFVGAGTLLILTLISYKLSKSIYCAHVTAIIYILFPFLAWIFHKGIFGAPDFIGKTMLHLGTVHPFSLTLWYQSLLMSYNCMSDNIGFFFPLCSMLLVAYMRKSAFKYIVLGFILGIGICVRYTSILIWPTVFMMDYYFNPNDFKQWKKMLLIYFPLFSIFAILSFLPQLIDNFLVLGNMFHPALPSEQYVDNIERLDKLFNLSSLSGFKYYIQINFKIMSLGILAFLLIKDKRACLILWTWIAVILIFHSLLKIYEISPVRYVIALYPPLYIVIAWMLSSCSRKSLLFILTFTILNFFLVSPENPTFLAPRFHFDTIWHYIIPLSATFLFLILGILIKMHNRDLFLILFFMLIFSSGMWFLIFLCFFTYPLIFLKKVFYIYFSGMFNRFNEA